MFVGEGKKHRLMSIIRRDRARGVRGYTLSEVRLLLQRAGIEQNPGPVCALCGCSVDCLQACAEYVAREHKCKIAIVRVGALMKYTCRDCGHLAMCHQDDLGLVKRSAEPTPASPDDSSHASAASAASDQTTDGSSDAERLQAVIDAPPPPVADPFKRKPKVSDLVAASRKLRKTGNIQRGLRVEWGDEMIFCGRRLLPSDEDLRVGRRKLQHVPPPPIVPIYSLSEPRDGDLQLGVCVVPGVKVLDGLGRGRQITECVKRRFDGDVVTSRQVYINPSDVDDRMLGSRVARRCDYSVAVTEITVELRTQKWLDTLGAIAESKPARVIGAGLFSAAVGAVNDPLIAAGMAVVSGLSLVGGICASWLRSPVHVFTFYVCNHLASSVLVERSCADPAEARRLVDQFFVRHSEMAIPDHFSKLLMVGTRAFVEWALADKGFWAGSTSGLAGLGSVPRVE